MHRGWLCKRPRYKEETWSTDSNGSGSVCCGFYYCDNHIEMLCWETNKQVYLCI